MKWNPPAYFVCGGVFMCRQYVLYGWILISFGVGVLVGMRLESDFCANLVGIGAILGGLSVMQKR